MRALLALCLAYAVSAEASGPGRSLPSGENYPYLVERIFSSPKGEVQFLSNEIGERVLWLRAQTGALFSFWEAEGSKECVDWVDSGAMEIPKSCILVFESEKQIRVSTDDLHESSLFEMVRKGSAAHVTL